MNLQIPYSWIKEYVRTKLPPEEFAARLSLSGPSVDRWWKMGEELEGIVVGVVENIAEHPNADKLRIARLRVGRRRLAIVCGGSNLRKGMKVAVALVGAKVRWHGEGEPVVLEKTKIRGVVSEGMICAANEIGLFDSFPHQEREILDLSFCKADPGTPVAEALELEDTIFDIEVTSNRPDAFSAVGIAREASVILGTPFLWKAPSTKHQISNKSQITNHKSQTSVDIRLESPKLCSRYQAAVVTGVQVKPSPWWMQKRLMAAGIRPISNIVDITNYVMLEQGQPMHAFDFETLEADKRGSPRGKTRIVVRQAKPGEKLAALDGNTYILDSSMLVIADAKRPIAIAGVMGGEESGVRKDTTTIIFESATFDPVSVRRTARALNLHSDSSLRFEKGLSTESTASAIARAVELAGELAGGEPAGPILDRRAHPYKPRSLEWNPKATERALGVKISLSRSRAIFDSLGFSTKSAGKKFRVLVPYWRDHDIEYSQDLDEEIGRIYGYHNLPSKLPDGELAEWPAQNEFEWEEKLGEAFRGAGFIETYSNSFVSRALLKKVGWDGPALELQNPLTEDLAVMRPVALPSLIQIVAENESREPEGAIFEIANNYVPQKGELPQETLSAVGAVWSDEADGSQFYRVKGLLEHLIRRWNLAVSFGGEIEGWRKQILHPARAIGLAGATGFIGELHSTVCDRFGIKRRVAVFAFRVEEFMKTARGPRYETIPQFPAVRRDISFVIPERTIYEEVAAVLESVPLLREYELFDVYRGKGIPAGKKSMAFHLSFVDPRRTLTGEEADRAFEALSRNMQKKLGAEVRSI